MENFANFAQNSYLFFWSLTALTGLSVVLARNPRNNWLWEGVLVLSLGTFVLGVWTEDLPIVEALVYTVGLPIVCAGVLILGMGGLRERGRQTWRLARPWARLFALVVVVVFVLMQVWPHLTEPAQTWVAFATLAVFGTWAFFGYPRRARRQRRRRNH